MTTTHYRACNLCEAICGLEIRVEDGKIVSIRGDQEDPLSRGHICPKAVALQDIHDDPDRLRRPVRRTAKGFQEIGWEEAFDEAAARIRRVQDEHGRHALAVYLGNPNVHNYGSMLFAPPFVRSLKTRNRFSATSVDQLPHQLASYLMLGHQLLTPVPDVDRTDFFLILGGNPVASNGSLMTAPGIKKRLTAIRARGGEVVVVDPRHTETAKLADQHLFIRPGTDALLLFGMLHTVFDEGRENLGHLAAHVSGLAELRQTANAFAPEKVAAATGIPASEIRDLTRRFIAARAAVCYGRMGISTQAFGSLCPWLINALNIVTGHFDCPGGAMFTRPAIDLLSRIRPGSYGRWHSRVRGLPEVGSELPVAALGEEILTPGDGQIRGLITIAGNPVLSTPNGGQLDEAVTSLDFLLAIDFYINETTRHADLILPPTSALEHGHYDLVFNTLAVRNTARYSAPLFPPPPEARHDWQIFLELQTRLATPPTKWAARVRSRAETWWLRRRGPDGLIDALLREGVHGPKGLDLAELKKDVHGLDLGPLLPCLPQRLFTPDKRIELAPQLLLSDVDRLRARLRGEGSSPPMVLIGRRQVRSNNSWMHNAHRLVKGKDRCTLLLHPDDAARLSIENGERIAVRSRVGRIEAPVEITDTIMLGVVSLPHGWGHGRPGVELAVARRHPGVSLNDLTDDLLVDPISGNAALNALPIELEKLESS